MIGCFCVVLVGLNMWGLVSIYQGQLEETATSTANMARALASHAERSLKVGDAVLGEMVERAEREQLDPEAQAHLRERMQGIAASTPEVQELFPYAKNGTRIVTSLPTLLAGSDADREFFRHHMQHTDRGSRIGNPIRSRSSGIMVIPLSRRIDRADGRFGGVAMASLNLQFFGTFHEGFQRRQERHHRPGDR